MTIFLSHPSEDNTLVEALQEALESHSVSVWADLQQITAGEVLTPSIRQAITKAEHCVVLLSPHACNSAWVHKEIQLAQEVQRSRSDGYKVIPVLCAGVTTDALPALLGEEVRAVTLGNGPNAIAEALPDLLAALGRRQQDAPRRVAPRASVPLAELTLHLTAPDIVEQDGTRRATALAELTYRPPDGGPAVRSEQYRVTAPLGPLEADDLAWYLERYAMWPSAPFQQRAREVEEALPRWGQVLYALLHAHASTRPVLDAWQARRDANDRSQRRFSVLVDDPLLDGSSTTEPRQARAAATQWLSLPWELLHDGQGYLFQGARGVRVRRQLPGSTAQPPLLTQPPLRVLLVSPRPEDARAAYLDHRASARPVVEALNALGELATYTLLAPPTFGALQDELQRAYDAGTPYHVVHFDGHGVYDRAHGLGALCFEEPADTGKTENRRSMLVPADALASVLRDHRVPLVFLEACQTAHAEETPTASVAARLLQQGVASVVAMSHSVLVETARRFVTHFYRELLSGARIGQAMLAGQRALQQDTYRGKMLTEELRLQDWFVPVLFQEEADPPLLTQAQVTHVQEELVQQQRVALGKLPDPPAHHFVGRSRELLAIERLLCEPVSAPAGQESRARYVVVRGEGGEGKTALAVDLARWLVTSRRFDRAAFVSLEEHGDARAVLFALGTQLVPDYVAQGGTEYDTGVLLVERVLRREAVLLVFDNLESVLPPPTDDALATRTDLVFEPEVLDNFLALARRLNAIGRTRLVFTSREALPEPFERFHTALDRLERSDAITLVGRVLAEQSGQDPLRSPADEDEEAIADLVDAVGCHARSLVLLAREVGRASVRQATRRLHDLMAALQHRYPNDRQRSLLASVALSLRHLPADLRQKLGPLGAFQGGGTGWAIAQVLGLDYQQDEEMTLGRQLEAVGLGTLLPVGSGFTYLRCNPALAPALWGELSEAQRRTARAAWAEAMRALVDFLYEQKFKDAALVARLTLLELPNLVTALAWLHEAVQASEATPTAGDPGPSEAAPTGVDVVDMATRLEGLLQYLGRLRVLSHVARVRAEAAQRLGWSHARCIAEHAAVERLQDTGCLAEAVSTAQMLLAHAEAAGPEAYPEAAYDLAMTHALLGRALQRSGDAEAGLTALADAHTHFTRLADAGSADAAYMASVCLTISGDCMRVLGRLDAAVAAYEEAIRLAEQQGDPRRVAIAKGQLGTVRLLQGDYPAALAAHIAARDTFVQLGEPGTVAVAWHQIGLVHKGARQYAAAEHAYQESLRLDVQMGNTAGQASTLAQLGTLYATMDRLEDAVRFSLQAADLYATLHDPAHEGAARHNAAVCLITLHRYDAARRELQRAIACAEPFGHAAEPWKTFAVLHDLERAVGNPSAAAAARQRACGAYLAYRRAGGVSQSPLARLYTLVAQALTTHDTAEAAATLAALAQRPDLPAYIPPVLRALQVILTGTRDPALADDPNLHYADAAELRLLLESPGAA
jgi:tetratricopeptide (TPR) repeat protein